MSLATEFIEAAQPITATDLRREREKAGIQQQVLAQALKIDRTTLSQIEIGMRPVPAELPARYLAEVRRIARERAQAVGAVGDTTQEEPATD